MEAFVLTYISFPFELEASLDDFAVYSLRVASLFLPVLGVMQPVSQPKPCVFETYWFFHSVYLPHSPITTLILVLIFIQMELIPTICFHPFLG